MSAKRSQVIRRSTTNQTRDGHGAIDFPDRNYSVPLVGCSNYTHIISTGDIIGVKLASIVNHSAEFESSSRFVCIEDGDNATTATATTTRILPRQRGSYRHEEEHLFVVTKVVTPGKYDVQPVFLDSDKVIVKEVNESFTTRCPIPIHAINMYTLCDELFFERSLPASGLISQSYDSFYCNNVSLREDLEALSGGDGSGVSVDEEAARVKSFKKRLPFTDFNSTVFDWRNREAAITEFYALLTQHRAIFLRYLGEEQVAMLGSLDCVAAHMTSLYATALDTINSDVVVDERVKHTYARHSRLDAPLLQHNITRIKYNDIFRVYDTDPCYVLTRSLYVSNWSGCIIDEGVRRHIAEGNIVRVLINRITASTTRRTDPPPGADGADQTYRTVVYCRVLMSIDATRHLACIENMYCSEYEDIVIVIDTRAITEVPFSFPGNEALLAAGLDNGSGEGFNTTGLGAVVTAPVQARAAQVTCKGGSIEAIGGVSAPCEMGQTATASMEFDYQSYEYAINYNGLF